MPTRIPDDHVPEYDPLIDPTVSTYRKELITALRFGLQWIENLRDLVTYNEFINTQPPQGGLSLLRKAIRRLEE